MNKSYKQLCEEIESLKKQAEETRMGEVGIAIAEVKRLVNEFNLTAADCGFKNSKKLATSKAKAVAPKFQHPENSSITWTGRGRTPKWLAEFEARGHARQEFEVKD